MERKQTIEILIAAFILLGLVLLLAWFLLRGEPVQEEREQEQQREQIQYDEDDLAPSDTTGMPDQPETIARVFVERFGSFSSESGYGNIEEVMVLATPGVQAQLEQILEQARASSSEAYYGVSTTVIGLTKQVVTDDEVEFLVTTQRRESIDSPANTVVKCQDINVTLVASGDTWLVSDFAWSD